MSRKKATKIKIGVSLDKELVYKMDDFIEKVNANRVKYMQIGRSHVVQKALAEFMSGIDRCEY